MFYSILHFLDCLSLLIKTDSQGNEEWNKTYGGNEDDKSFSVQQTTDDGYIITGVTDSYGSGEYDIWLVKTDIEGNEEWNQTFGGTDDDMGYSVNRITHVVISSTKGLIPFFVSFNVCFH